MLPEVPAYPHNGDRQEAVEKCFSKSSRKTQSRHENSWIEGRKSKRRKKGRYTKEEARNASSPQIAAISDEINQRKSNSQHRSDDSKKSKELAHLHDPRRA